jgi:hypothetical protein
MREHFAADWVFGIQGAIENEVRTRFPDQQRQWPLLQTFNFEAYAVGNDHFVVVLRDKLSGIPAGPGELKVFPYEDHPPLPLSNENVSEWLSYLIDKFALRNEDVTMVLPIRDSGQHGATADFEMFSDDEKALWYYELQFFIDRQTSSLLEGPNDTEAGPETPTNMTFNVTGTFARVTINSTDNSVNVVNQTPPEIFAQLLEAVRSTNADAAVVTAMVEAVEDMQRAYGSHTYLERYQKFMSLLADHIQVFAPTVASYLPVLAQLLHNS